MLYTFLALCARSAGPITVILERVEELFYGLVINAFELFLNKKWHALCALAFFLSSMILRSMGLPVAIPHSFSVLYCIFLYVCATVEGHLTSSWFSAARESHAINILVRLPSIYLEVNCIPQLSQKKKYSVRPFMMGPSSIL